MPLTKRQKEILDFLESFLDDNGYPPSFEEIARHFGYTSLATVHEHLENLRQKGYIRKSYNASRSIELVGEGPKASAVELPLLGRVAAGAPIEAIEDDETIAVPEDLLEHRCLLLRFAGSQQFRWTLTTPTGPLTLPVEGTLDADDGDMLTEWALLGQGIALKPAWEVAPHLRAGRLEVVLPDLPPEPAVLAVLYPHRRLLPAKVKAFADFIVEHGPRVLADLDL